MEYLKITRINPKTGSVERPWRNRDHFFVLGDPAKGEVRHHDEHAVKVDNYGEALELVRAGFAIRMSDGKSPPSLVVPGSLDITDGNGALLDEFWTYTMPEVPFTREALDRDVREALLCHAGEIAWIAGEGAASAFIGFDLDLDEIEHGSQAAQIELGRFNLHRLAVAAYESAFRVGKAELINDDDIDEIELVLGAMLSRTWHRYPHPCDRKDSPLRRTLLSAYLRWKIYETRLIDDILDQSAVESLAVLAGMTEQAVRNSLAKEGLSAVRGKSDYGQVIRWLENRRDFVPLREGERLEARATWSLLGRLGRTPLRDTLGDSAPEELVDRIVREVSEAGAASPALLREYARCAGFCIDTLVREFGRAMKR